MKLVSKSRTGLAAALVISAPILSSSPSAAYPIDCAILLCLAGGFPASTECAAAKVEFIRRITPWPIEPPLQLWNCPMGLSAETAQLLGTSYALGADGLTPEIRQYRDGIEIYHVRYRRWYSGSNEDWMETDDTESAYYDESGAFRWRSASYPLGPSWLREITQSDDLTAMSLMGHVRGVAIRWLDHAGNPETQWIAY